MRRFLNDFGNKILTVVGVVSAIALVLLIGNSALEDRENKRIEAENETIYTTTAGNSTTTTQQEVDLVDRVALPDVLYVTVDEPLVIRFMNITGYNSLDDFSVKMETDGKGTVYKDRWEYTPSKAETFTLSFEVTDKSGAVANESTHTIMVKEPVKYNELSVLVIGDSTVAAGFETEKMLKLAREDNCNLKLLGTLSQQWLKDSNNRHEGRGGWKARTYVEKPVSESTGATNPFYNPETESFDFAYYMEQHGYNSLDVVCLQLGINDVFGASTDSALKSLSFFGKYFNNMDFIIENIHMYNPNIKIIWNLILPCSVEQGKFDLAYENGQTAKRCKRNTYLTNLEIVKHIERMENVFAVPTNAVLDTKNNMAGEGKGAVHPSKAGYYEIGALLYNYIRTLE